MPSLDDSNVRSEEVPQNSRTPYSFQLKRGYPQIHCFVIISPSQISTSCWLLDIHFILVGGAMCPSWKMMEWVRQWVSDDIHWHPIYEMEHGRWISCLKPPTSHSCYFIAHLYSIWYTHNVWNHQPASHFPWMVMIRLSAPFFRTAGIDSHAAERSRSGTAAIQWLRPMGSLNFMAHKMGGSWLVLWGYPLVN